MDLQVLALAKNYTDKQIEKAEMGDIELDQSLSKSGFAADAKIVGDKFKNLQIPTIDNTLTQEGAAADAKAVGEALKNSNSGKQIQADWEQNDDTAADFIKGRTHYKQQITFTVIENQSVAFKVTSTGEASWNGSATIKIGTAIPALISENDVITAVINDNEWSAFAKYDNDNEIFYAKVYDDGSHYLTIYFYQHSDKGPVLDRIDIVHQGETIFNYNDFVLSLSVSGNNIIQIPSEYIPINQGPDTPASVSYIQNAVEILNKKIPASYYDLNDLPCYVKEATTFYIGNIYLYPNSPSGFIEKEGFYMGNYELFQIKEQNYPKKQYTPTDSDSIYYYCGNGSLIPRTWGSQLENTGEDFVVYAHYEESGCSVYYGGEIDGEYYFELYGVIPEEIKELDERCIPNTIARTTDISTEVETALAEAKESGEFDGPQGPAGNSGVYVGEEEPTDETINVWINPNGSSSNSSQNSGLSLAEKQLLLNLFKSAVFTIDVSDMIVELEQLWINTDNQPTSGVEQIDSTLVIKQDVTASQSDSILKIT